MGNIQRKKVKEGEREREKYKDIQRKEKMMRENTKRNRRNNSGDRKIPTERAMDRSVFLLQLSSDNFGFDDKIQAVLCLLRLDNIDCLSKSQ